MKRVLAAATLMLMGAQCSGIRPDAGLSALAGGDLTALMDGCGQQLQDGLMVCRKSEGPVGADHFSLIAPPTSCQNAPCVSWKLFFPDGSPSLGGTFPKDQSRISVAWKDAIKREEFIKGDRGFWALRYWIKWHDTDGREHVSISDGYIYLVVVDEKYVSLHSVADDPNFVWDWEDNGARVKMTTGARTYVEKKR